MTKYVSEPSRRTTVLEEGDVIVVGAGMAGLAAAVTASRAGARTVLVEKFGFSGGLATGGLVNMYWVLDDGEGNNVVEGLNLEILARLRKRKALRVSEAWRTRKSKAARVGKRHAPLFDPEVMKYVGDVLLLEASVKLYYHTLAVAPLMSSHRIRGVLVEMKEGRRALLAPVVIDATGDADICHRAGAPCEETESETVAAWFRRSQAAEPQNMTSYGGFLAAAPIVETHELMTEKERRLHLKGTTSEGLTKWELEAREIIFKKLARFQARLPGGKGITVVTAPVLPNLRKTRRIVGEYEITSSDNHRKFPDALFTIGNWKRGGISELYHLPYRCLLPQRIEGLLAAGRCISTANDCWDVFRIIAGCVRTGEAAGAAAACAVKQGKPPRDIDAAQVRELMQKVHAPVRVRRRRKERRK